MSLPSEDHVIKRDAEVRAWGQDLGHLNFDVNLLFVSVSLTLQVDNLELEQKYQKLQYRDVPSIPCGHSNTCQVKGTVMTVTHLIQADREV